MLVKFLRKILTAASDTESLRFSQSRPEQAYVVALYGSIVEFSATVETLLKNGRLASVPITLRALLEVYADLLNLMADPSYMEWMHATHLEQKLQPLLKADGNPFLELVANNPERQKLIAEVKNELQVLKTKGITPLNVFERFERAELGNVYRSVYWHLCQHSHGNLPAVEGRHIRLNKGKISVSLFPSTYDEWQLRYLETTISVLLQCSGKVRQFLGTYDASAWEPLVDNFKRLEITSQASTER